MAANLSDIENSETEWIFFNVFVLMKQFMFHVMMFIIVFGVVSNSLNILIFYKMGLKDNLTITLFSLSVSDLMYLVMRSPWVVFWFLVENYPHLNLPTNDDLLMLGPSWCAQLFYDFSAFVSVFLAVVRCACVARPLKFKSMFTKSRTVTTLVVLFFVAMVLISPLLMIIDISWVVDPTTNATYRSLKYSGNFQTIYKVSDIFNRNILAWLTYATMIACVVILSSKLLAASRFRQSLANHGLSGKVKTAQRVSRPSKSRDPSTQSESAESTEKEPGRTSTKELQVIKSVTVICVIFIFSQLPTQAITSLRLFDSEFYDFRKYYYFYVVGNYVINTLCCFNASVNILVHFHFNSRYREKFFDLFYRK
ncbi:chemosensory receptor A [Elysia marginata]|uniref:Chemosensory receptor A n=1 Tax=Elysia marginata TaxID=1093978 RepID=A0AAV4IBD3_9GAST|nr:chemosensory receptor A [Elysia marginata]